jgi:elongation factor P--(R)-beta-lysine ligase
MMTIQTLKKGRCIGLKSSPNQWILTLSRQAGNEAIEIPRETSAETATPPCQIGDIVEWNPKTETLTVLTRSQKPGSLTWNTYVLAPRRQHALRIRQLVESGIREYFQNEGFLETPTPILVPCPGMEIHIRPFQTTTGAYLPTSPEFAMKRLLVGGLEKIFQLTQSFRAEPNSSTHHPEFRMLEWYRAYAGFTEIMEDTENLVEFLARKIHGKPEIQFNGQTISVKAPWKRVTVASLFSTHVGISLTEKTPRDTLAEKAKSLGHTFPDASTWDDLFFLLFLNEIEPRLPKNEAIIVSHYPPSQAALSVIEVNEAGERWARRFEFYIAGIELGNAFEELTDSKEQRKRFIADMNERQEIYGDSFPKNPLDEDFLSALEEGMPPSGGIAVGVDRLVMCLSGETDIDQTLWLPSFPGNSSQA